MKNKIEKIQVLGSGCPTCKKLLESTKQATMELGIETEVEYTTDIQEIIKLGVMSAPVLNVNDQVVLAGRLPKTDEIKELLQNFQNTNPANGTNN